MPPPAAGPKARNASAHSAKIDLRPLIGARMVAGAPDPFGVRRGLGTPLRGERTRPKPARSLDGRAVVLFRAVRPGFAWPTRISSPTRKPRFSQAYAPA